MSREIHLPVPVSQLKTSPCNIYHYICTPLPLGSCLGAAGSLGVASCTKGMPRDVVTCSEAGSRAAAIDSSSIHSGSVSAVTPSRKRPLCGTGEPHCEMPPPTSPRGWASNSRLEDDVGLLVTCSLSKRRIAEGFLKVFVDRRIEGGRSREYDEGERREEEELGRETFVIDVWSPPAVRVEASASPRLS